MKPSATLKQQLAQRRKERQTFRIYANTLEKLDWDDFCHQATNDMSIACTQGAISDALRITKVIHRVTRKDSFVDEESLPSGESKLSFSFQETSQQRLVKLFFLPFPRPRKDPPSNIHDTNNEGESPLQIAAMSGSVKLVHFMLACYVLFHIHAQDPMTRDGNQRHSIVSWTHKIQNKNTNINDRSSCLICNEELILTMAQQSSFSGLYELKFSLPELADFVEPFLSPYKTLVDHVLSVSHQWRSIAPTTVTMDSHDSLPELCKSLENSETREECYGFRVADEEEDGFLVVQRDCNDLPRTVEELDWEVLPTASSVFLL